MTKEIKDINGTLVKAGHIIRISNNYYTVGVTDNELCAEKLGSGFTITLAYWDDGFEIIGQTVESLLTQPANVQKMADNAPEAPIHLDNNEASSWQVGWTSGYLSGASSMRGEVERLKARVAVLELYIHNLSHH